MRRGQKQKWVGGALGLLVLLGVATPALAQAESLYLALELRRGGELIARPKLLGEAGKTLRAERRQPGAVDADYQLVLQPFVRDAAFQVHFELVLPEGAARSELAIAHGEERRVRLGSDFEVSLLLMKVDSPEFRALMRLDAPARTQLPARPTI